MIVYNDKLQTDRQTDRQTDMSGPRAKYVYPTPVSPTSSQNVEGEFRI